MKSGMAKMFARALKFAFGWGHDAKLEEHNVAMQDVNGKLKKMELALNGDSELFIRLDVKRKEGRKEKTEEFVCKQL